MSAPLSEQEAFAALEQLYAEADMALASLGAACDACGACCRFAEFEHVLMCTNLEAALLIARHGEPPRPCSASACGFHVSGRCIARAGRPLACRTFLCSRLAGTAAQRRMDVHERIHRRIQILCRQWINGYRYGPLWALTS